MRINSLEIIPHAWHRHRRAKLQLVQPGSAAHPPSNQSETNFVKLICTQRENYDPPAAAVKPCVRAHNALWPPADLELSDELVFAFPHS
jgi:hypothetical protein